MKIAFLIYSLQAGGAERVASVLCNHWLTQGHQLVLITFDDQENDFYKISDDIKRYVIEDNKAKPNLIKLVYRNLMRLFGIRRIVLQEKPDVVVSFMDVQNMQAALACSFTGIPVVISERTYPPYFNHNNIFDILRKTIYQFSSLFVAQTNEVAQWAQGFLNHKKVMVIANPLNDKNLTQLAMKSEGKNILAIGRLCKEKGFDLLIRAFKELQDKCPEWRLLIVGEGPERDNLQQQIQQLNLHENVILVGKTTTPEKYFSNSEIFVLSSRVEGFPNVLLEAMAAGLAVVSFDCKSGPKDIIVNEQNGLLLTQNDELGLTSAIHRLIIDPELRKQLGREATKVREKYRSEQIAQQWLGAFKQVLS